MPPITNQDMLYPGQQLWGPREDSRISANNFFALVMHSNGNLVTHQRWPKWRDIWETGTAGRGAAYAFLQYDGRLVLYNRGKNQVWSTPNIDHNVDYLRMQDDANVVIYSKSGRVIWASGTVRHQWRHDEF